MDVSTCRVAVVDYGIGNVESVAVALRRLARSVETIADGDSLRRADFDCLVLPGVGAVGEALRRLRERDLEHAMHEAVIEFDKPLLGICVGMHVLLEQCEEFGVHQGFGWIPGRVKRLAPPDLPVPHTGWNTVEPGEVAAWLQFREQTHQYFVHSYAVDCDPSLVSGWCNYGGRFAAAIQHGHICAVQFHPEKSSADGERVLNSFLAAANAYRARIC
jgi:glutamine amidotransferase